MGPLVCTLIAVVTSATLIKALNLASVADAVAAAEASIGLAIVIAVFRSRGTVNIEEIRKPETDAQLIADSISQQLEKRIMFRRAMKRAMQNAMRLGAQGIKIMSSGRLNGIEIARTEWYREGRVPLHTLKANIDYGTSEAHTTYGVIGIKVWVYKGDMLANGELPPETAAPREEERRPRRAPRGDRPDGARTGRPGGRGRGPRKADAAPAPEGE